MSTAACFAPVDAATGKTLGLAMQRLWLTGQVLPAGARLTVQHVFRSQEEKPIEVIYAFPLPRDAALRRFRITGDGFEANSELRETEAAVKTYEEGIAQGSLSALVRQYGDGLVNLTVGNIRPKETITVYLEILAGVELRDDGFRLRFPFTLAPVYHSRAKTALVAPGEGELEMPHDEFGDAIFPRFHEDASALHQVGFDLSVVSQLEVQELGSPSHPLRVNRAKAGVSRVSLASEKDAPDRDLVLDARFEKPAAQVLAGRDKEGKGRFAAIVPSTGFGENPETPRRVVILLDRSGSMGGAPLQQAAKAIEACLGALSEKDQFGLVAFDDRVELFEPALTAGSRQNRDKARTFLQQVDARGGTELARGVAEAAKLLGRAGGDILILTDGQVGGTEHILAQVRKEEVRLHCLGIGSASQDRFLALLARDTGGVSRFVTAQERVDLPAVDLFASIGRPVAVGLKADRVQPEPPPAVFAGTPVLLFGEGEGPVELKWDGGQMTLPVAFDSGDVGETVWLLQGSRLITDWESRYPSEEALAPLDKRKQSRVAMRLKDLSEARGRPAGRVAGHARGTGRDGAGYEVRRLLSGRRSRDGNRRVHTNVRPQRNAFSANAGGRTLPGGPRRIHADVQVFGARRADGAASAFRGSTEGEERTV
jgi:Ca-activated chloride channel family protein